MRLRMAHQRPGSRPLAHARCRVNDGLRASRVHVDKLARGEGLVGIKTVLVVVFLAIEASDGVFTLGTGWPRAQT